MRRVLERLRRQPDSKRAHELRFWRERHAAEGEFANAQFEQFFTTQFGLERRAFGGKRMLDIGCGPRGSLEWATMATERVGVDPLVGDYRALGIDAHAMQYVEAPAEHLPFEDRHFDVISCFNALDHVDDVDAAIAEITRVAAPGATGLLLVEVEHAPTVTEPHMLSWDILDDFAGWNVEGHSRVALDASHNVYKSWLRGQPWTDGAGLLAARLTRNAT
jgi:SAM-dependent methyltransferase